MALSARRAPAAAWASRRRAGSARRRRPSRCGGGKASPPTQPSPPLPPRPPGIAAAAPGKRRRCAARAEGPSERGVSDRGSDGRGVQQGFRQQHTRCGRAGGTRAGGTRLKLRLDIRNEAQRVIQRHIRLRLQARVICISAQAHNSQMRAGWTHAGGAASRNRLVGANRPLLAAWCAGAKIAGARACRGRVQRQLALQVPTGWHKAVAPHRVCAARRHLRLVAEHGSVALSRRAMQRQRAEGRASQGQAARDSASPPARRAAARAHRIRELKAAAQHAVDAAKQPARCVGVARVGAARNGRGERVRETLAPTHSRCAARGAYPGTRAALPDAHALSARGQQRTRPPAVRSRSARPALRRRTPWQMCCRCCSQAPGLSASAAAASATAAQRCRVRGAWRRAARRCGA